MDEPLVPPARRKPRVLAYDASTVYLKLPRWRRIFAVERTWPIGAKLFGGSFDYVVPAKTWGEVLGACEDIGPGVELHVWGHGIPGAPLIAGRSAPPDDSRWEHVALVWFRSCDVLRGSEGYSFAIRITRHGTAVAGHTVIVGWRWGAHSHLYGLTPGQKPWWPHKPTETHSAPLAPRTVMFWNQYLPAWALFPED